MIKNIVSQINPHPTFGCSRCNLFDHLEKWPKINKHNTKQFFKKHTKKLKDGICLKSSKITNHLCGACENCSKCDEPHYDDRESYYDTITYVKPREYHRKYFEEIHSEPYYDEDDDYETRVFNDDVFCNDCGSQIFHHDDYYGNVFT